MKIQTEIKIHTKEIFRRKGFGLRPRVQVLFFSTASASIVEFGKRLFVTVNLVAFISVSFRFLVPLRSISIHVFSDSLSVEFAFRHVRPLPLALLKGLYNIFSFQIRVHI